MSMFENENIKNGLKSFFSDLKEEERFSFVHSYLVFVQLTRCYVHLIYVFVQKILILYNCIRFLYKSKTCTFAKHICTITPTFRTIANMFCTIAPSIRTFPPRICTVVRCGMQWKERGQSFFLLVVIAGKGVSNMLVSLVCIGRVHLTTTTKPARTVWASLLLYSLLIETDITTVRVWVQPSASYKM